MSNPGDSELDWVYTLYTFWRNGMQLPRTTALIGAMMLVSCTMGLPGTQPELTALPDDDDDAAVEDDGDASDDDDVPADDDDVPADDDDAAGDDDDASDDDDSNPIEDDDDDAPGDDDDATDDDDDGAPTFEACFADIEADPEEVAPDYSPFSPTIGSHCNGTNHQSITGIERVVFLGDSVTVGTPPTADAEFYRSILSQNLVTEFGLTAPDPFWNGANPLSGEAWIQDSGDFSSCASWGARADDLMQDDSQVLDCLPESERDKVTLVIMTVGGNDLNSLLSGFNDGEAVSDLWAQTEAFMALVRDTVEWITAPGRFPNGVHVITTNLYEYTDATGDVTSCPAAGLAGYEAVTDPALAEMVVWAMEEFMSVAVDTNTDMLFLLESFCGHGFNFDDATGRCYRGAGAELWFDLTCVHPNPVGHAVLADMFMSVVTE
jgi:lysophospholipase L1-like esterase